jgi:exosome complex exonuclease DIS3/RRP44
MTYEEAQMKIDDLTLQDNLSKSLRVLNSLAKILKKRRIENGYVVLKNMLQRKMWH